MYQIVKAKFAAKNPAEQHSSLLESFCTLKEIANTENEDYVWQIINESDLDFNLAAERLLLRPPPARGSPAVSQRLVTGGSAAVAAAPFHSPVSMPVPFSPPSSSILRADFASLNKRHCFEEVPSPATVRVASSAVAQTAPPVALIDLSARKQKSSPEVVLQAKSMLKNLTSKVQAGGGNSSPQELACLEFNMICDTVSGSSSDNGVVHELNNIGAFLNVQQLALSGQLWSFVPIVKLDFFGAQILTKFSNPAFNHATQRCATFSYRLKLNSIGLSLKLEFQPSAPGEEELRTELLLPFSCFTLPYASSNQILTLSINAPSDVHTDSAFRSLFDWKGKPLSLPPISRITIFCNDIREAQSLEKDIAALKKGKAPHALDLPRLAKPLPKLNELSKSLNFHLFSDPWHLAMVLFDEKLLLEVCNPTAPAPNLQLPLNLSPLFTRALQLKNESPYPGYVHAPPQCSPDIKFVLSFKLPSFLLPVMMRAQAKMQLSTWSRDRPLVCKLFDRLLKVRSVPSLPAPPPDSEIILLFSSQCSLIW